MPPQEKRRPYGPGDNAITSRTEDRLGFGLYVPGLCDLLVKADTPYAIGVFGDWGTGKTSMMRLIQEEMETRGHVTVWFNPWKYDNRTEVRKALIRESYTAINTRLNFLSVNQKQIKEALRRGGVQALNMLGRLARVGEVGSEVQALLSLDPEFGHAIEAEFTNIMEKLEAEQRRAKKKGGPEELRLVILVDDLDRCAPDTVVECVEAIKLFLDFERCVFVIGAAEKVIRIGLESKYPKGKAEGEKGESGEGDCLIEGREYLKKIIQLPFYLRAPEPQRIREFIEEYAEDLGSIPRVPEDADNVQELEGIRKQFVALAERATGLNMREVKRFVSTHALLMEVARNVSAERVP